MNSPLKPNTPIIAPVIPDLASVEVAALLTDRANLLANEIAANLQTVKEILAKYNIKHKDFAELYKTKQFKAKLTAARLDWASDQGQKILFAKKAAMAAEDGLIDMYRIVKDTSAPASNRISAHQHLAAMGNVMPTKTGPGEDGSNKHTIIINIGKSEGREPLKVEGTVIEHDNEN